MWLDRAKIHVLYFGIPGSKDLRFILEVAGGETFHEFLAGFGWRRIVPAQVHPVGGLGSVDALQGCWVPQRTCYSRPSSLARITAYNLRMLPRFRFRYTQRYFDIPDSEGVGEVKSPIIDHRLRGCQMNIAQGSESDVGHNRSLWRLLLHLPIRLPITFSRLWALLGVQFCHQIECPALHSKEMSRD